MVGLVKVEVLLTFDGCESGMFSQLKIKATFTANHKENLIHLLELAEDLEKAIKVAQVTTKTKR